jgi:hypothetical protein
VGLRQVRRGLFARGEGRPAVPALVAAIGLLDDGKGLAVCVAWEFFSCAGAFFSGFVTAFTFCALRPAKLTPPEARTTLRPDTTP